ncbi:hypothetical protein EI28_04710 [Methanoculleus sp. MH98A]|nr:hypothetical protein EI28_04710 [Methanoculleus sp. MH98A]
MSSFGNLVIDGVKGVFAFAVLFATAKILLSSEAQPAQDMGAAIMVGLLLAGLAGMAVLAASIYKPSSR